MALSKEQVGELIEVFRSEAVEHVQTLTEVILGLEDAPDAQADSLNRAYREAHNLKGSSAMLGFSRVSTVTHKLESLIADFRDKQMKIDRQAVDRLLSAVDAIKNELGTIGESVAGTETDRSQGAAPHAQPVARVCLNTNPVRAPQPGESVGHLGEKALPHIKALGKALFALKEKGKTDTATTLADAREEARGLHELSETFEAPAIAHLCSDLLGALEGLAKNQQKLNSDAVDLLLTALEALWSAIEKHDSRVDALAAQAPPPAQIPVENSASGMASKPAVSQAPKLARETAAPARAEPSGSKKSAGQEGPGVTAGGYVRVAEKTVDSVIAQVDELFEESLRLEALIGSFNEISESVATVNQKLSALSSAQTASIFGDSLVRLAEKSNATSDQLRQVADKIGREGRRVSKVVRGAQQELHNIRLAPLSNLFISIRRQVRELSRATGKELEVTVEGGEHKVDRRVSEALEAPIIHILRNAADHGIEEAEERVKRGKPPVGQLRVVARHLGDAVELTISDDGRGIDPERIRASLIRSGRLTEEQASSLPSEQLIDYLFEPGFSTRTTVSEISGRGVGMDVVKTAVESLGGEARLESRIGEGTRVVLRLPLTMSTLRCLLIKVSQRVMALPAASVDKVVAITSSGMRRIGGAAVIDYQSRNIPLFYLSDILQLSRAKKNDTGNLSVAVIRFGERLAAFVIDEVVEYTVLILTPLADFLEKIPNVSGLAPLNTGELSLVLNPSDLVRFAHGVHGDKARPAAQRLSDQEKVTRILVVDDSIATRTLEKTLLEAVGFEVIAVADGYQALKALDTHKINLVITDVQMPNMDGFELTRKIKSSPQLSHLPVLLVTSLGSDQDKQKGVAAGADAYIVKSQLTEGDLVATINQLL